MGNGMLPRKSYRSAGSVAHGTALPDLHTQMRGKLLDESTHPQRAPHERFDAIWEYPLEGHSKDMGKSSALLVICRWIRGRERFLLPLAGQGLLFLFGLLAKYFIFLRD